MKSMVSDLVTNEEVTSFFFVPELPQIRKSKKDRDYVCLKLQDKTGTIDGRIWDIPPGLDATKIAKNSFVKLRGQVTEWQEVKQVSISQLRIVDVSDDVELGDFFERSERDPRDMLSELCLLLDQNVDDYHVMTLMTAILSNNQEKLLQAPAAKSVHHAYIGGLLEHMLSMTKIAIPICKHYDLNNGLVLAACVLHDIGKIHELTFPIGIGYSLEGTLLGHISIGMQMASDEIGKIKGFPQITRMALLHLVASHHGLLEYGSPKVPLMREAIAFHLIDMLDAQMAICARALKKGVDDLGLTEWVKELGGPLYAMKEE